MQHFKPRPLISVIIPVFVLGDHVADCLRSLQAQTLGDFEAQVIDDGSTDNTAAIAEKVIGQDPRFQLIKQQNRGALGALAPGALYQIQNRGQHLTGRRSRARTILSGPHRSTAAYSIMRRVIAAPFWMAAEG